MTKRSIFFDEWQACLRAHYIYVLRIGDAVTESTLRGVLLQSGLTDDDLRVLYREGLASEPDDAAALIQETIPAEIDAIETEDPPVLDEAIPEEEYEPLEPSPEETAPEEEEERESSDDSDDSDYTPPSPRQLSLF